MKYLIAFALFFFAVNCRAQFINSIEFKGGLHDTKGAETKGYNLTLQVKRSLSRNLDVYAVAGNYWWNQNVVHAIVDDKIYNSFNESDHKMYLFGLGLRREMDTVKTVSFFLEMEMGLSYITYNKYENEILAFEGYPVYVAAFNGREVTEYTFLAGFGAGIVQHMRGNLALIVEFKLNAFRLNGEAITNYMIMSGFSFGL
ncbi:hypothetical protein ACSSWA_05035 [Melioribacter sp. Ez-97]|uniref:hypothetical protein n=1 Tax=Melioribacter sp. Ez-97 TaxID=3423434 RepID=UPI003ED86700